MPDRPLLLITATELEAEPLKRAFAWQGCDLPLGSFYRAVGSERRLYLGHLGVGKVNTAAALALAIERLLPGAVIQFGVGGAYVGSFLSVGMVAVAQHDIHIDTGLKSNGAWHGMNELGFPLIAGEQPLYNLIPTDQRLTHALVDATNAPLVIFGTSETVTGDFDAARTLHERFDLSVESMEGAAAAQVCYAMGVPFAQIRAVSNIVGETDKRAWNVPKAVQKVNDAILGFVDAMS